MIEFAFFASLRLSGEIFILAFRSGLNISGIPESVRNDHRDIGFPYFNKEAWQLGQG